MLRKICVAFVAAEFVLVAAGSIASTMTHGRCAASVAQAQDIETASSPEAKAPPPDIAGTWSGMVDDHDDGTGAISLTIDETSTGKLSGGGDFPGGAFTFTGSVKHTGIVKFTFKAPSESSGCHLKAVGMLVSDDEITGVYKVDNCGKDLKGDHGSFDITD